RLCREGAAQRPGRAMDEGSGSRVVLPALDREGRASRNDDVELFVPILLAVLLDHALTGFLRGVRVDAERANVEVAPDRTPRQPVLPRDRERLQLVDEQCRRLLSAPVAAGRLRGVEAVEEALGERARAGLEGLRDRVHRGLRDQDVPLRRVAVPGPAAGPLETLGAAIGRGPAFAV